MLQKSLLDKLSDGAVVEHIGVVFFGSVCGCADADALVGGLPVYVAVKDGRLN